MKIEEHEDMIKNVPPPTEPNLERFCRTPEQLIADWEARQQKPIRIADQCVEVISPEEIPSIQKRFGKIICIHCRQAIDLVPCDCKERMEKENGNGQENSHTD